MALVDQNTPSRAVCERLLFGVCVYACVCVCA